MKYSWGSHPNIKCNELELKSSSDLKNTILDTDEFIIHGNGRSYGDSGINKTIVKSIDYNSVISFNEEEGILEAQSGILLKDILKIIVPKGWFLKVTPGSKYITLGGAIASDVHGKNHHIDGCFSESVLSFNLMLSNGRVENCKKRDELFLASCGGMGLTGVILDAKISLMKINSKNIDTISIKTNNLQETFDIFESKALYKYSVAWLDTSARDTDIGRGVVSIGDFSTDGDLSYVPCSSKISIPSWTPSLLINKYTVMIFNFLYYNLQFKKIKKAKLSSDQFFYPLDGLNNWNNLYGKDGFIQYQFILPKEQSYKGMNEILKFIASEGLFSFLAVLKLYGAENENYLSFPLKGYSLAIDFKLSKSLYDVLKKLDKIVLKYKGRIYLSKDVRVNKEDFEINYSKINQFRNVREKYQMNKKFQSLQSKRVKI